MGSGGSSSAAPTPPSPPKPTNPSDQAHVAAEVLAKYGPIFAAQNYKLYSTYAPGYAATDRQDANAAARDIGSLLPKLGQQAGAALEGFDPQWTKIYKDLGSHVEDDMALGHHLSDEQIRQAEQATRAGQTARGNAFGDASTFQEALAKGNFGEQLYQERLANAGRFLSGGTMANQVGQMTSAFSPQLNAAGKYLGAGNSGAMQMSTPAVQALTNVAGGMTQPFTEADSYRLGMQAASLSGGSSGGSGGAAANPWVSAGTGALSGAATGSVLGPYGALGGAIVGGALGYFSSSSS